MSKPEQLGGRAFEAPHLPDAAGRRQLLKGVAAVALAGSGMSQAKSGGDVSKAVYDLDLSAAATAIRSGAMTSEYYATKLLDRAAEQAQLNAFISIDRAKVLEAARTADKQRAAGLSSPLLGVPIGVKDSYLTQGLTSSFGTAVLRDFRPNKDAAVVAAVKSAGAIVLGKNNLAEMSYGLTGMNDHYGQAKNPHNPAHITGGSSSGAGASVAARIVPAALGGDTVGSIRVPASLCGVVGFKPTPGRWPSAGVAPISGTLDTTGALARSVKDCALLDTIVTRTPAAREPAGAGLRGVRFAFAPRQHLDGVAPAVEATFRETLRKLKDAGATIIEIELGSDFNELADKATWPIFFHETMPAVREFVALNGIPASFEQIYEALGTHFKGRWARFVVPGAPNFFSDATYQVVLQKYRPALQRRYSAIAFSQADVLLLPTTPCPAPTIEAQWKFSVAGREVADTFLARNTHPASCAGIPGISIPMGLSPEMLPLGLELDAGAGNDRKLLGIAYRTEQVLQISLRPANIPA
jgi:mandelamide amidase